MRKKNRTQPTNLQNHFIRLHEQQEKLNKINREKNPNIYLFLYFCEDFYNKYFNRNE